MLWGTSALSTVVLALSGMAAHAEDAGLWQPQVRAIIGANSNSGFTALEGFLPLKQNLESVLFLDVRSKYDFDDGFGQDVGLGVRRIVNPDLMIGGYAYLNIQNSDSHQFVATTLGLEAITSKYDAHVNVYLPLSGDRSTAGSESSLSLVGNQLLEEISAIDHRTYAAWGIEGEVGIQAPIDLPENQSLRFDVGAYHFADPDGDDRSITGAKAGIEYTIGDVVGKGTSLTFTGEVRNDNRDDTQFAGSIRLTVPFNVPGSGSSAGDEPDPVSTVSPGLRKRLNERVRGDVGVRLENNDKVTGTTTRVAINAATNAAFGNFFFADGGNSLGLGTIGDPTTLDDAVTKAGGNGFIVALGGSGNITTGGVNLTAGQTVIGGGGSVQARLANGSIGTYNFGGSNGTIQGTNPANPVITLASNNTLSNITITGGGDGIFGNNAAGTKLTDVTVDGAGGNGANFTGNSTSVTASGFTAQNNGIDGLHIEGNGTYNFTGTTLLQGNADDGLDAAGQGTYTFATLNALDNDDAGITVKGTSSGGSITITGGQVSGNKALGDDGVGVFIDPITAHIVLDSITQDGGTSGVVLDHVSGSFTVNGATNISNTTGSAIAITDSPATIRFGDISIANPGGDGMSFTGVNAAVVAGNIVISGLGVGTGLDFSGSQTNFTAQSLNLTGSNAMGSIGIDLADTTGDASIIITNGGSISGVDTGVRLGISGSLAHSANAEFTFGGGSIAGITASLDARGLNQTLGHYAFGSTTFIGPQLFDQQNVIFVGGVGSSGDGSSTSSLLAINLADADTDSDAIFVLVNEGSPIDAVGGFSLSAGQTLASFGNGRTFSLGGVPINVTGDNIQHDQVISDPGGAATLTNSGAGDVVTAANGNSLLDFNISGGSGAAINASGISGLTVQGVTVSSVATGLLLNNFSGTGTFNNFDVTSAGTGVSITGGSTGTLTFDAASSIAGTTGVAFNIDSSTPNLTYSGTINQTSANSAVKINAMTGGSATFAGKITASTGAANAIDLSGNTGGTINFTGGLDLTTDGGFGFTAVNGGTLTVTGSNTITTGGGAVEKGLQILGGAGGIVIGSGGVSFDSVTVDGSGGSVPTGIVIDNTSGGNVTFGNVNISRANGDAIRLSNIASGTYTFNGTTTIATVGGPGPGFVVQNSAATVGVNNLVTTSVSGADVSLTNNTGTIGIGGTIGNSGTGDGVVVSGGSAAITIGATINSSASAPGTAAKVDGITGGSVTFTGPITSTGTGTGVSVTNTATGSSVGFGAVTVSGAAGNGIDIGSAAGAVTFSGTTSVTMGSAANTAGINFSGTNNDVTFGTTTVSNVGANQTGIDFSGSSTTADFGLTTITGTGALTSRGIDLSSTTGTKTITFLQGSKIDNLGVGVELASDGTTATSANANFTFGDGDAGDGRESTIIAAAGGYTVNTIGLDPTLGNYDFDDVAFTGPAHLASAVGGVIMVSQNGGVIAAGTNGLSADVTTISVAAADAMVGTQTFAFVGTVDLSSTAFTLDSGQSIDGFGNGNSILTSGTIQPINVQGNLGATGGNVTGDEGVVKSTGGDSLHLLGSNQVRNTAFDFSGGSGSVFLIDQNAAGFNNAGGIFIEGVTVSNVATGQTAFKVDGLTTSVSITNNNINVAGTLLDADGGNGNITLTRGTLPNSGPAGTLTGGGINIANRTGGLVNFTDKATIGGNGVSLTGNTGATITFADLDVSTSGVTAFSATGGGTVNVTTGTLNATNAQAAALDGIIAGINFASTNATFSAGNGIDLQNLSGTAAFGTGTLTNTGSGTSFNVGSATAASGGNAVISYGGTIATNGTGAAVSIQGMTGGSVSLSGNLTDNNAAAGGNIEIAGNDSATITFSGSTKQISSGAVDGVNIGFPGGFPMGTPSSNTNTAINFTGGGLDITTTTGAGFGAFGDFATGTLTVTGAGNKINSGADGLIVFGTNVGAGGITFDSVTAVSTVNGAGVLLGGVDLAGDVNIGGLKDTGYLGASLSGLTGAGVVNFTGTTDLDVSNIGFDIGGPKVGIINIANVAGSTLTIDGANIGIAFSASEGTVNIGGNGGSASIGATTSTTGAAITLSGGNDLVHATLNYNGSIKVDAGNVLNAGVGDYTALNMSGSVVSTTTVAGASAAFLFSGHANGVYNISSTIDHKGGVGVRFNGSSDGTVTFSGTSKIFDTGANNAIVKEPAYVPDPQTKGTLNFTNGGLVIKTTSGTGFTASTFGPGTVSVTGTGNTITTTNGGMALKLGDATAVLPGSTGATVGAAGIKFDSISTTGAATGISLNDVSGGAIDLGTVNLLGITGANARGVDISGTLGANVGFTSLNIVIGASATNAVGLDLNGAALGASNITAGDFDVDGGGSAGSIGIDMAGTTGTGTIQLGDTNNNNPAGQTSTIANVGYGVQFSSATNARLVFGDGAGPAESSIATTGGQVIHATDTLPTNGDYDFDDVNFTGDTSNLSTISVFYVDLDGNISGTGDGSLANPGSLAQAQASTANVVVLIDKNTGGTQETLDLSGGTFQLDDGQVLLAFKSGDASIDASQLGVSSAGGASGVFHFTTVQNSTIVDAPAGIDTLRPILQSNTAGSVVNLATSGTGLVTGGLQNLIIRNTGAGTGVAVNAASASSFFLRNNDIAAGGRALDFATTGAPANTLLASIDGNTLASTGSALAASFAGQNISATANSIAIRSFSGNTVTGGTGGGIAFNNVTFDSTGSGGTVSAGTLTVGTTGARVQGDGLNLTNTSGTLDLGTFTVANNAGTGVLVDTKGANTNFTLNNSGGSVDTTNGAALNLDPLTVNITLASVTATGGAGGIIFDGVAGTFTVTGATSITGTSGAGVSAINTNTGTFNFNTVTVNNAASAGGGIGWASGTLNVAGLANIDTTSGAGLSQTGGTTAFTGGLTIDTTSGDGILGVNAGTISVTGSGNTVTTQTGRIVSLQTATIGSGMTFDTLKATGTVSGAAVQLATVSGGAFDGGDVTIAGASSNAITVQSNTSSIVNFDSATISSGNANGIHIVDGVTGAVTFGTVTIDNTNGNAVRVENTSGTVNINGGSIGATNDPNGVAVQVVGGASTFNLAANVTKTSAGKIVDISGVTGGTVTLSGNLSATGGVDNGIYVHANTGGTFNFSGATKTLTTGAGNAVDLATNAGAAINFTGGGLAITTTTGTGFNASGGGTVGVGTGGNANTISTGTGVAVNMNGVAVAAGGVNFASTSNGAGGTSGVVLTGVTGAGTVNLGTGALVGGSAAAISVTGGSVNLTYAGNVSQATAAQALLSVSGGHTGTLTFNTGTLSATNGTGLQFDNADGTYNFNGTTTLNGGDAGVDILNGSSGTFSFGTGTSITSPSGIAFNVVGGTASVTYSGNITQANNAAMVSVSGGHATGTITFQTGTLSATNGTGLQFDNADGTYNFNGTTTLNGGDAGIDIVNGSNGVFSFSSGTSITNPTGVGFNVNGGSGNITYAGTISKTNANSIVSIQNRTGGTTTLSGNLTATTASTNGILVNANTGGTINFSGATKTLSTGANTAVNLTSNSGATINFTGGGLDIDTTSGIGFNATGGGTVTVTTGANPNTITSTTGTALNVANTTIGASGLTFRSITSNGAANGIVLNNTGTSGGLTVTGDGGGSNNGSGGTIQASTGDGISLTNTQDVHLAYMNITNNLGDGIGGSGINGFVLNRLNISGNGDSAAADESGINITQLTGTASNGAHATSISNSVISNNNEFEIQISNSSGTLTNLQLISNTISANGLAINGNASSSHGNLVNFLGLGTSVMGLTVTGGSFTGNTVSDATHVITGTGVFGNSGGTSMTVNVSGATFTNNNAGVDVSTDPAATSLTFDIENNTFIGQRSTAINHFDNGNSPYNRTVNGTIKNNIIGDDAVTNSGSTAGNGISIQNEGAINGKYLITGNTISQIATAAGISVNVGLGGLASGGGETDITITNNVIRHINGGRGIIVQDNQVTDIGSPPGAGPFPTIWANIQGNSFSNIAGQAGNGEYLRLKQSYGIFKLTQTAPTASAIATELDDANGINDPSKFSISSTSGSVQYGQAAAPLPTTNPLP